MEAPVEARCVTQLSFVRLILVAAVLGTIVVVSDGRPLFGSLFDRNAGVGASSMAVDPPLETAPLQLHLTTDGPSVKQIIGVVRSQARQVPGAQPDAPVTVVLTTDVAGETGDERALLAGMQRGETAWVRTDGGWPERTLIHEVAHVVTDGDGHGEIWRAVYLGAIEELFGEAASAREQRRIARIYDRCYLDDTCPARDDVPQMSGATASAHHHPRGAPPWQRSR